MSPILLDLRALSQYFQWQSDFVILLGIFAEAGSFTRADGVDLKNGHGIILPVALNLAIINIIVAKTAEIIIGFAFCLPVTLES